jgi:hypothetical protein
MSANPPSMASTRVRAFRCANLPGARVPQQPDEQPAGAAVGVAEGALCQCFDVPFDACPPALHRAGHDVGGYGCAGVLCCPALLLLLLLLGSAEFPAATRKLGCACTTTTNYTKETKPIIFTRGY